MNRSGFLVALLVICVGSASASAAVVPFLVEGRGGVGLLAGNENHAINGTPGSGGALGSGVSFDTDSNILSINVGWGSANGFANLSGNATMMHIHGPTASGGVASFAENAVVLIDLGTMTGFNASASSGGFNGSVTLNATQAEQLLAGRFYLNTHTALNGPGEIRGNLTAIPEPGMLSIGLFGFAAFLTRRRRSRS